MKRKLKQTAVHIGLFCTLLTLLWLAMSFSAALPNQAIYENYKSSALFYGQDDAFHFHHRDRWNAIADNYADAVLLDIAWHMGDGRSPFAASIETDYYDGEELGENAGLYLSVTQGAATNTDYTRYWHGGAMFIRLFHLFTDVNGMKTIGFLVVLALAALTMAILSKKGHFDFAVLLLLSLMAVQVWNIRLSLEYQSVFLVTFLMCPLFLLLERKGDAALTLLSTASGVLVAFFDFLTTETLTILLPLILVTAVRGKEGRLPSFQKSVKLLLACGLCWGAAYAGTFLVKWVAASLVTGENAFALAIGSASIHIGTSQGALSEAPTTIFSSIFANLTVLFGGTSRMQPVRAAIGMAITLGGLGSVWYLFRKQRPAWEAPVLVLMLGSVVFLRFLVVSSHSYRHAFFTYRALAAPLLAALIAVWLSVDFPGKRGVKR